MDNTSDQTPRYDLGLVYSSSRLWRTMIGIALLYAGLEFIGSTLVPPVYSVSTEEVLPANLEESWEALTDFSNYPEWNPYLPMISGDFVVGSQIKLTLVTESSNGPQQSHAQIAEITPFKQFAWQGGFPIPGIANTLHVFSLEKIDEKNTRLVHYEEFRGLAVALDSSGRADEIQNNQRAFKSMNKALRLQIENNR